MSLSSQASLGALRIQAQQRADMEYNPAVSTPEWNQYISLSYKELYDKLAGAYDNNYSVATPFQFTVSGTTLLYSLPTDFYKLLGVDMQCSATPSGWLTMKKFEFIDRNRFSYLTSPAPIASTLVQLWYVPEPTSLQFIPICSTTASSTTVGVSDSSDLAVGMQVYGSGIAANTTVTAVNTTLNQVTLSVAATLTQAVVPLYFWTDAATMDGIAGWEEYVIVDAAIKASIKTESSLLDGLVLQKNAISERITEMAEGRDIGQAHHVSDALTPNAPPYLAFGVTYFKYCLMGSQIMFMPCATYEEVNPVDSGGWGY